MRYRENNWCRRDKGSKATGVAKCPEVGGRIALPRLGCLALTLGTLLLGSIAEVPTTASAAESPAFTVDPIVTTGQTTALVKGTVDPHGEAAAVYVEYAASPTEPPSQAFEYQFAQTIPAGTSGPTAVSLELTGLNPGRRYYFRLLAEGAFGEIPSPPPYPSATTAPIVEAPTISSPAATGALGTQATLHAQVNPGGAPTSFHFEYLTKGQYEAQSGSFAGPNTLSTPPTSLGFSDNEVHEASYTASGLEAGATYYFRAVATNESPGNPVVATQARTFTSYAGGSEPSQSCPNEQLRSENNSLALPECRAYEQVSPPYKQSHEVPAGYGAIGPDGSTVLSPSLGAFAGTGDDPIGPGALSGHADYRFDRTPTGWETTPLDPPAGEVEANGVGQPSSFFPSVDARGLVYELPSGNPQVNALFVREADGALRFAGPMQNPATLNNVNPAEAFTVGTSADNSMLFFYLKNTDGYWPGDTTVAETYSLYEAGLPEPKLVGISNAGRLQHNSEAELISSCGTELAIAAGILTSAEQVPNSVSSSGRFVYFKALPSRGTPCAGPTVEEIYVRVDGEKTIPVSEPILPPGEECTGSCEAAEPKSAEFQGATDEGRNVFFTTSQPLLNADQDETKDLYEAEIVGEGSNAKLGNLTLVSKGGTGDATPGKGANALGVLAFSRDASRVYFAAEGSLTSTPSGEGEVPQPAAPNLYSYDSTTRNTTFVVTLQDEDGDWLPNGGRLAQATPDGRYLVFGSEGALTPDDTSPGSQQLFEYDAASDSLVRVSVGDRGYNDNGNSDEPGEVSGAFLGHTLEGRTSLSIAPDGAVFFQSRIALTPGASNEPEHKVRNIYEYRAGRVSLIAPGVGLNGGAFEPNASATQLWGIDESGENVFFSTVAKLTPTDTDDRGDIYDARVHGGFAVPAVTANCAASASCQGSASPAPGFTPPATATFSGPANKKPPPPKKKHHKKKHHKKKHHKKNHGGSSKQRRAGK